jgi:hypothetical protein
MENSTEKITFLYQDKELSPYDVHQFWLKGVISDSEYGDYIMDYQGDKKEEIKCNSRKKSFWELLDI